jgi:hypothetical protein
MKTSLDYSELAGLKIALANAQLNSLANQMIIDWIQQRIKELEKK